MIKLFDPHTLGSLFRTPLQASEEGHADVVAQLLARGADIEARDKVRCPLDSYGY